MLIIFQSAYGVEIPNIQVQTTAKIAARYIIYINKINSYMTTFHSHETHDLHSLFFFHPCHFYLYNPYDDHHGHFFDPVLDDAPVLLTLASHGLSHAVYAER